MSLIGWSLIIPGVLVGFAFFTFLNWAEKEFGEKDDSDPYNDDWMQFI